MPIGRRIGLVNNADWRRLERKEQSIALAIRSNSWR
jgi:hypothetical protein